MECVLEIEQNLYKTFGSTRMRLFDVKNDRQDLICDEYGSYEKGDDFLDTEEEEEKALFYAMKEQEIEQHLIETNSTIVKVRFLWNF